MTTNIRLRRFHSVADFFGRAGKHKKPSDKAAPPDLQPHGALSFYLSRDTARKALSLLLDNICKENPSHHDRIVHDLETGHWSALTDYAVQMAFFESIRPPVRPLALPSKIADWLLALPNNQGGYHPEDMCWECGYAYPFSWATAGSATHGSAGNLPARFADIHPWVGRHCLYCGGEIVNHLEWLSPNPKRTLSDFHNAPYRKKRESMESHWRRELNEVQIPHQGRFPSLRP
jgi:hypothetical protein